MPKESDPESIAGTSPPPVFIMGISERSGTNFLFHLLCLHPDCEPGGPIWENYLTLHLDLLVRYAEAVYKEWNPNWNVERLIGPPDVLLQHLGDGVLSFLERQRSRRPNRGPDVMPGGADDRAAIARPMVTKMPSVRNLQHFFRVFPHARLLIIVRDGRAVVESGVRTFHWPYEDAMHDWTEAARTILAFMRDTQQDDHRYLLVRFEDLFHNTEREMRRILGFLDLSVDTYDFEAARRLPMVGSSELLARGETKVHWNPVQKSAAFDPTRRWHGWGKRRQDRFTWIAGPASLQLGYPMQLQSRSRLLWATWNTLLDRQRSARRAFRRVHRRWVKSSALLRAMIRSAIQSIAPRR
jgi:protein-tyrosine sulfotransferase